MFGYYAQKVSAMLHRWWWHDNSRKECEVDRGGCCSEILNQNPLQRWISRKQGQFVNAANDKPQHAGAYLGVGGMGREVMGQSHLIILKTRTLKWYILMLFETICNCKENVEHNVSQTCILTAFQTIVTSENILKTRSLKHVFWH